MPVPISKSPPRSRVPQELIVTNISPGKQLSSGNVSIEIIEVNEHKSPAGPTEWIVAYRIIDRRQSPLFVSQVAHLFVNRSTNLLTEFRKVRDHYEKIKGIFRS